MSIIEKVSLILTFKNNRVKVKDLVKDISIATLIIVKEIVLPSVLGLSTYGASSRFWIKGLFNAQNSITVTLLIQLSIVLLHKEKKYLILYLVGAYST